MSARFDDLRQTAKALRNARMMLRARPDSGPAVTVFDGSILATAAVSAPEEMIELAAPVLDRFADLGAEEHHVLFETFQAWLDNGGSPTAAAEVLCCHRNTVRYRLHRIGGAHRAVAVAAARRRTLPGVPGATQSGTAR
jgi:DNA-binding PucR family transcriptional regulator